MHGTVWQELFCYCAMLLLRQSFGNKKMKKEIVMHCVYSAHNDLRLPVAEMTGDGFGVTGLRSKFCLLLKFGKWK